jgi:endonuclease YncB( thermonuclease family)
VVGILANNEILNKFFIGKGFTKSFSNKMNKENNFIIFCISILGLVGYFIILLSFLPFQEVDGRCPNGFHKSPSGDCEKVTDTKGMPKCPNGYHRSPDGDCEKVSKGSSDESFDIDDDDFTKNKKKNSKIDEDNSPLNQIFKSNNDEKSINKVKNDDVTNYKDDIELDGKVTYVVDGDTLDINDIRIRLSLVDTPERGQDGYKEAKNFVKELCLNKKGEVDIDDGQRRGDRYGRDIGIVYCDSININAALMENNLARIYLEYCDISEFSNEKWAKPYC